MSHDYEATILSQMPFSLKPRLFDPRRPFSWKWNNIHFIKQLLFLIFGTYIETTDIKNSSKLYYNILNIIQHDSEPYDQTLRIILLIEVYLIQTKQSWTKKEYLGFIWNTFEGGREVS